MQSTNVSRGVSHRCFYVCFIFIHADAMMLKRIKWWESSWWRKQVPLKTIQKTISKCIHLRVLASSFYLLNLASYGGISHLGSYRSSYRRLHKAYSAIHILLVDYSNHRTVLKWNINLNMFRKKIQNSFEPCLFRFLPCCLEQPWKLNE